MTRIIVNDFECKNKCLHFVSKLYVCYCHIRNFIKILLTKFQRCRLLCYCVTVHLVTSPKITALLHHSAYVIVHSKVIKMEHLNKSKLWAQAVRLIEENYTYSVIAKKLGRSKAWVGKWAKHWKTNVAESLQSQSRRRLTNKTALNITAQKLFAKQISTRSQPAKTWKMKGKQLSGSRESIRRFLPNKLKWRCLKR